MNTSSERQRERAINLSQVEIKLALEGRLTHIIRPLTPQPVRQKKQLKWLWIPKASKPHHKCEWRFDSEKDLSKECQHCGWWTNICPFGKSGDTLWAREAFCYTTDSAGSACIMYRADSKGRYLLAEDGGEGDLCGVEGVAFPNKPSSWRSSIRMPRWASRLAFSITGVSVIYEERQWLWSVRVLPPSH